MITAGIDVGSRSAQAVILEKGKIISYSNIETGPDSAETAHLAMAEALPAGLFLSQLDYIAATGYGRIIVPFANENVSEITCHARGANRLFPSVRTILDMGGQDCKAISCDEKGKVTSFVMNDKCAGGTGRFFEIIADVLKILLKDIGELSLQSKRVIPFNTRCAVFAKSDAIALARKGIDINDILAGLHDAVSRRVTALIQKVGIAADMVVTGGIAKNIGVVRRLEEKLGIKVLLPKEPQIVGALGAATIAKERLLSGGG